MTIKLSKSGAVILKVFVAIVLTLVLFKANIANAHTLAPQMTTSPATKEKMTPCPVWKGLIEPFRLTLSQSPLSLHCAGAAPGIRIPELERPHVPINTPVSYNSNPPTSGPHYPCWADWGIYEEAPADGFLVHNLEHGGVIISYNPDRIKGQALEQLRTQARELSLTNGRLILTPRSNLNAAIALTAWGYLLNLNRYNQSTVKAFYEAHIARGPECEKGRCPD
jgi:hypothetical protein